MGNHIVIKSFLYELLINPINLILSDHKYEITSMKFTNSHLLTGGKDGILNV